MNNCPPLVTKNSVASLICDNRSTNETKRSIIIRIVDILICRIRMNSLKHYLVILTISALPLLSMFLTKDMPHTHDGPVHLARIASYYKELSYGQIPPRWASELNYAYGMPLLTSCITFRTLSHPYPYIFR